MSEAFKNQLRRPSAHVSSDLVGLVDSLLPGHFRFVSAPAGSGKTTLLRAWRDRLIEQEISVAWVSLTPAHSDPALLVEEWTVAIRNGGVATEDGAPFGETLLKTLSVLGDQAPASWALHADRALRKIESPVCILFDNLHLLEGRGLAVLEELLRIERDESPMIIIASRGSRPAQATRALTDGRAIELDNESLALCTQQIDRLAQELDLELEAAQTEEVLRATGGWATGVVLALRQLAVSPPEKRRELLGNLSRTPDLFAFLADEVVAQETEEMLELLGASSILGPTSPALLFEASATKNEGLVDEALRRGLILSADGEVFLHHLWSAFFRERLQSQFGESERKAQLTRLGGLLAKTHPTRAIPILAEAEAGGELAALLVAEGVQWWERGYRGLIDQAFAPIPDEALGSTPRLELVAALQNSATDPDAGLTRLAAVADALRDAGDREGEDIAIHRGVIVAGNASREAWLGKFVRRLVSLRRLVSDPAARALGRYGLALGALFSGRYGMAERIIKSIDRSVIPGEAERAAPVMALAQLHRHFGTWDAGLAVCDEALTGTLPVNYPPARELIVSFHQLILGLRRAAGAPEDKSRKGTLSDSLGGLRDARDALRSFGLALSDEQASLALIQVLVAAGHDAEALLELDRSFSGVSQNRAWVGQAHSEVIRASILTRQGQKEAALGHARGVLTVFESKSRKALGRNPMTWCAAVAAWLVAENGDLPRAEKFLRTHATTVRGPNAPLIRHATHLCQARIAMLAKNKAATAKHLKAAWRAAQSGPIVDAAPDVRGDLLVWAFEESKSLGIETPDAMWRNSVSGTGIPLSIRTLGELKVEVAGKAIPAREWRGKTSRRLLARLLLAGPQGLSRERVQDDLWPELPPERAANNLRVALTRLRGVLRQIEDGGESALTATDGRIELSGNLFASWDITPLQEEIRLAEAGSEDALDRVFDLYTDPLLPDFYDDWILELRGSLENRIMRVGTRFVEAHQKRGEEPRAAAIARKLLRIDSTGESLWLVVGSAELGAEDRTAALRTVSEARAALKRGLDVESSAELDALEARARTALSA